MTVIDPAVTLQVSENDKVLEPYRHTAPHASRHQA
jgi:hypothetical protein